MNSDIEYLFLFGEILSRSFAFLNWVSLSLFVELFSTCWLSFHIFHYAFDTLTFNFIKYDAILRQIHMYTYESAIDIYVSALLNFPPPTHPTPPGCQKALASVLI